MLKSRLNYFHGSCKFYHVDKEMPLVPPKPSSVLNIYMVFATVECEPLTFAHAVQGDSCSEAEEERYRTNQIQMPTSASVPIRGIHSVQ